ncbi:MAG: hypothetical protein DMG40_15485 [Acidobacteria bacterium]|nr:MAG: hypothetical protein DMG40_15485 [Acidobacteriota bacterium]
MLTLALGIGANTAIFSVVENVLLRPLPYPQPENLVQIWNTYQPQVPRAGLSPGDYADWKRQNSSFSEMGAYVQLTQGFNLTGEGEPQRVLGSYASVGLFPLLGSGGKRSGSDFESSAVGEPVWRRSRRGRASDHARQPALCGRGRAAGGFSPAALAGPLDAHWAVCG